MCEELPAPPTPTPRAPSLLTQHTCSPPLSEFLLQTRNILQILCILVIWAAVLRRVTDKKEEKKEI